MNVLIADDDPDMVELLDTLVEGAGHAPFTFQDSAAALARLQSEFFPIAIVDYQMPGMNGIELCRRFRASQAGQPYTIVLMVTAFADKRRNLEALDAGADDFMAKPLDSELFVARLRVAERMRLLRMRLEELGEHLPICMHCFKIRDEAGAWQRPDSYVAKRSEATFSHGLCPSCLKTHYPES